MNSQKDFKLIDGAILGKEQKIILDPDFFASIKLLPEYRSDPNTERVME